MEDKYIQYFKCLKNYPKEVDAYFGSAFTIEQVDKLAADYGMEKNDINEFIIDVVSDDFNFEIIEKAANKFSNKERFLNDFIGLLFLPIDKYLDSKVSKYFSLKGVDTAAYMDQLKSFSNFEKRQSLEIMNSYVDEFQGSLDEEAEKAAAVNLFSSNLGSLLRDADEEVISNINSVLMYLLNKDVTFHEELSSVLLESDEVFTRKPIENEGKMIAATVASWLRDFFKSEGAGVFDALKMTKYLTVSKNVQSLDEEEKQLVIKLIKVYGILKFFPSSLEGVPMDQWQIIPMEVQSVTNNETEEDPLMALNRPVTVRLETSANSTAPQSYNEIQSKPELEQKQSPDKEKQVAELSALLATYSEGSLERKMVEEEIKKIEQSS